MSEENWTTIIKPQTAKLWEVDFRELCDYECFGRCTSNATL